MKKSLLALAAMGAFAGAAQAQSSVSVYGILDTGYAQTRNKLATGAETTTTGIGLLQGLATSRLGFRGTEDLGGGLTAGFQIEGGVQQASDSTTAFIFNRHQFLTLNSKSAGGVLIGRTDALIKTVFDAYDAGYSNNVIGKYSSNTNSATEFGTTANRHAQRDTVIRYTSPSFSGVTVLADFLSNNLKTETAGTASVNTDTAAGFSVALRFAQGPISAAISHRNAKTSTLGSAAGTANTTGIGSLGAASVAAADSNAVNTSFGASYNFGPAMVMAQYFDTSDKNNLTATEIKEKAYSVGVRVPVTKTATLFASYYKGDGTSATSVTTDFSGMQFGAVYDLSKRTSAYGIYGGAKKQQNGSNEAVASGIAVGVRHTF